MTPDDTDTSREQGPPGEGVTIVLATGNQHKLAELRRILEESGTGGVRVLGLRDLPPVPSVTEDGLTFAENSLLKSEAVARATGLPTIADDSGLCVGALGGAPGIFSARWCGRHGDDAANLDLLLAQLADLRDEHRSAWFACAATLSTGDGRHWTVEGRVDGWLIRQRRGENGFGYDPIFVPDGEDRTTAQMTPAEKDAISHRGRALRGLLPLVSRLVRAQAATGI
jgi:XTP/dITP diphosphohydrolase